MILHMSLDQCVKALAEHASITPLVTLTGINISEKNKKKSNMMCVCVCLNLLYSCCAVWKELQKENKDFFRAYFQIISPPRPFITRKIF